MVTPGRLVYLVCVSWCWVWPGWLSVTMMCCELVRHEEARLGWAECGLAGLTTNHLPLAALLWPCPAARQAARPAAAVLVTPDNLVTSSHHITDHTPAGRVNQQRVQSSAGWVDKLAGSS